MSEGEFRHFWVEVDGYERQYSGRGDGASVKSSDIILGLYHGESRCAGNYLREQVKRLWKLVPFPTAAQVYEIDDYGHKLYLRSIWLNTPSYLTGDEHKDVDERGNPVNQWTWYETQRDGAQKRIQPKQGGWFKRGMDAIVTALLSIEEIKQAVDAANKAEREWEAECRHNREERAEPVEEITVEVEL